MTALLKVAGREGSFEKFPDFGDTSKKEALRFGGHSQFSLRSHGTGTLKMLE